ncbi:MAG TPA: hypothetical protein VFH51_19850 [Myxococcota bacterium]|nr:hypothetical protein [Myxococcota bacterium]
MLQLDANDSLIHYSLTKRTCGAEIGDASLLLPRLRHAPLETLLDLDTADLQGRFGPIEAPEEFLYAKHAVALCAAAEVLTGRAAGEPGSLCTTTCVVGDSDGLVFEGLIGIEAVTARIKACGNCGSCGSRRKR